jgi:2-C-methyl-D-erythritol 4-phosphate cytidylyltransferase/2-C-methyl-D-erythritol 2,4-cyclodiphosphate synthase
MAGVCALIPAAGRAVRYGATGGKLFEQIHGRSVLDWTIAACAEAQCIDRIVVVVPADERERFHAELTLAQTNLPWICVAGGASRQESVLAGLDAAGDCDLIAVHDAARPAVLPSDFRRVVDCARENGAAVLAIPIPDTLVRAGGIGTAEQVDHFVDRDSVWAVQTPQVFHAELLRRAHTLGRDEGRVVTDDAGLVHAMGHPVHLVAGSGANPKLTRPADKSTLEALLELRTGERNPQSNGSIPLRIGHGYDVHRCAPDRPLWLGGVAFPDAGFGLEGHSDADVLLHALCDALLGAAGLPDIGHHFPNNDPAHRNRASLEFVSLVGGLLRANGWSVVNVDMSLMAERPKIGSRIPEMRTRIAGALGIDEKRIGVKATTNERLGFVGREEGISAHAVVLLQAI